jgi:hypothetical protein
MARLQGHGNIFCLESHWDARLEDHRQTVRPILEMLRATRGHRFIHLSCNTRQEFEFNLRQHRRYRSFLSIYLAFHGQTGVISLADGSDLTLQEVAAMAPGRLSGCLVHFGSCFTAFAEDVMRGFLKVTRASLATGYTKKVDWIDSAAMDLLLLDWAAMYQNSKPLVDKLHDTYPGLVAATGFVAIRG